MLKLSELLGILEKYERFLTFYAVKVLRALHDAFPQAELDVIRFLKGQSFAVPLHLLQQHIEKNSMTPQPAEKISRALFDRHQVLNELINTLGDRIGRDIANRPLLELMEKGEIQEQGFALATLACLGHRKARESLRERLLEFGRSVRWSMLVILERDGDMEWTPLYLACLHDGEPEIARIAVLGLGRTGNAGLAKDVLPLLESRSETLVSAAVQTLGMLKNPDAVTPLIDLGAATQSYRIRATVVSALGEFGESASIPFLAECLSHTDTRVRANAALALKKKFLAIGKTDEAILAKMKNLLRDKDHRVRADITQCLWELGRIESIDHLKTMMRDERDEARASAAYICGKLKLIQLKDELVGMTLDEAWPVRKMAALSLLGFGHQGQTALNHLFIHGNENQQVCSALALSLANDRKGIEHLFAVAKSESELADLATELLLSVS